MILKNLEEDKVWVMNHFLTCLAEECGEVMEILYKSPEDSVQLEYELNDIIGAAKLLRNEGVLDFVFDSERQGKIVSIVLEDSCDNEKEIFNVVKDIQYFAHKSIRFGLDSVKPDFTASNVDFINKLIKSLSTLMQEDKHINLWDNHDAKINKIMANLYKVYVPSKCEHGVLDGELCSQCYEDAEIADINYTEQCSSNAHGNKKIAEVINPQANVSLESCTWVENDRSFSSETCMVDGEVFDLLEVDNNGTPTDRAKALSLDVLTWLIKIPRSLDGGDNYAYSAWILSISNALASNNTCKGIFDLAIEAID